MKSMDIGIDDKGNHDPQLTDLERDCLDVFQATGEGAAAAISAQMLASQLMGEQYGPGRYRHQDSVKRDLRQLINHLIMSHRIPIICQAGAAGGYYLAGSATEVDRFYRTFHRRAMTGLLKASRGKKAAFVQIVAQLSLGFDDAASLAVIEGLQLTPDEDPVPAWVQVATKLLDRISADPERYAAEIRRLQQAYGDIFVPREKVARLKAKTAEFQQLLSEIAGGDAHGLSPAQA